MIEVTSKIDIRSRGEEGGFVDVRLDEGEGGWEIGGKKK